METKITAYTEEEFSKTQRLLALLPEKVSKQVEQIEFKKPFGSPLLLCDIKKQDNDFPVVFLPRGPESISNIADGVVMVNYKNISFQIPYETPAKKINYVFVECVGLEQFEI